MVLPVGLPVAPADRRQLQVRRRQIGEPLISVATHLLRTAPDQRAPTLATLHRDQAVVVLMDWQDSEGRHWLRVRSRQQKGWLAA